MIPVESITGASWRHVMRAVRSYVARRVSNPEDRDDLVQEVLLRVHSSLPSLRTKPGPWIYRIAHNAVVDYWRKQGRAASVPIDEKGIDLAELPDKPDSDFLRKAVAAYLSDAISRLDSPYRETLTLTELRAMKYTDAARVLGVSLAAIKSRVLRGRAILRQILTRCCEIELGPAGGVVECTPRDRRVCTVCDT